MAGIDLDLSSVASNVGSWLGPTAQSQGAQDLMKDLGQKIATGAVVGAGVTALSHGDVLKHLFPIDPLGLANKADQNSPPALQAPPAAPAPKTIGLADLAKIGMTPQQAQAMGYTVV